MNVVRMCRGCCVAASLWSVSVWAAPEPSGSPAGTSAPEAPAAPAPSANPAPGQPPPAAPAASNEESEAREVAADAAFRRGNELADRGLLELALAEFEKAYDLSPAYEVLYNIGAVCYELRRWARARRAYEQYLKFGGPELAPERVERVSALIAELTSKTATLRLMLNVTDADILVDGEPVESNEVSGVILDPGEHVVTVSKPGFSPLEQVLRASDGESVQVVLPLAPLETGNLPPESPFAAPPRPRVEAVSVGAERTPLWVPWTITGVLAAGWMTTAGLAIKARHDRDIIERPSTSADRIDDARQLHQTLAIVSDVLLASTLASAGVSAYLTWWPRTPSGSAHTAPHRQLPAEALTLGLSGQF